MRLLRECLIAWEEPINSGKWHVVSFDGVVRESHSGSNEVTGYPVDSGFRVSDHTIRNNRMVELDTVTSNFSMKVATMRKGFAASFAELMTYVNIAGADYKAATKYGRAAYDNDEFAKVDISIGGINISNPINSVLNAVGSVIAGQVSLEKVDSTLDIIDKLNAKGTLVHLITMRKCYANCVIRTYTCANDASNAYSAPITMTLEVLNVVDLKRSGIQSSITDADGEEVAEDQSWVKSIVPGSRKGAEVFMRREAQVFTETVPDAETGLLAPTDYFALNHKEVPFSSAYDTTFLYQGVEYTITKVQYNAELEMFTTNLMWRKGDVWRQTGYFAIGCGLDLVEQHNTGLPSLVAVNINQRSTDIRVIEDLRLFIIEDFEKYFVRT